MNLPSQTTVLQVSDTHLSPDFAASTEMWTAAVRYIERTRPDFVIHTGDAVHDDPDDDRDHEYAAFQLRRLTTPWRIVPGNHDIGDSPPDPFRGLVSTERLARFRRHFGPDRWSVTIGGWQLIGLNSLLFDNHLAAEEADQWDWLEQRLREADGRPVGLFMHKPPAITSLDEDLHVNKSIGRKSRRRLLALTESGTVKLIGSGHLHEHVVLHSHGALLVGAPALGPTPAGTAVWNLGLRCNGLVEYRLSGDTVRLRLLRESDLGPATPPGRQIIPSAYARACPAPRLPSIQQGAADLADSCGRNRLMAENGTRVKAADNPMVYVVLDGKRRALDEPSYVNIFSDWEGIDEINVDDLPDGGAIQAGYIGSANGETYLVADTIKYRINGNATADRLHLKVGEPRMLSTEEFGALSDGAQLG